MHERGSCESCEHERAVRRGLCRCGCVRINHGPAVPYVCGVGNLTVSSGNPSSPVAELTPVADPVAALVMVLEIELTERLPTASSFHSERAGSGAKMPVRPKITS